MKKLIFLLLQLLIVLSCFAQVNKKYTSVSLNLREDSNSYSKIITVIPKATAVTMAEDCNCEWILISYNGQTGYVYSKYLSKYKHIDLHNATSAKHHINSNGERVQSPSYFNSAPAEATALCRDGTYSFSRNRRGTCSHHGGVARWL